MYVCDEKAIYFFSHFSIIKIPWFLLSFSFHWALQFECLAHQSILLWLHFTWFHDICIIWSFCTTTLSHKIDRISKLLAENQQIPWNTRPLLRVNAMFQSTKIGYLNISYVIRAYFKLWLCSELTIFVRNVCLFANAY